MFKKLLDFIVIGLSTPFIYLVYSVIVILTTFVLGFPIGLGIYFIELALKLVLGGL
jgi:hypothetical protein